MIPLDLLKSMARKTVSNYIAPGLSSSIIGEQHDGGCVRLFQSSRDQQFAITPHSHRFDFSCLVIRGTVTNRIWTQTDEGDVFEQSVLEFDALGKYTRGHNNFLVTCSPHDTIYTENEVYSMDAGEVHSIYFGAQTDVLFFEGPMRKTSSVILEPYVDGAVIRTFAVEPWMFKKAVQA